MTPWEGEQCSSEELLRKLRLKRGQERRLKDGYPWVFSNQVDDPLKEFQPGEIVRLTQRGGRFLGVCYVNPHSLIACRLLTRDDIDIDVDFFIKRFERAHRLRQNILPGEAAVREVFSESDGLPGLMVDRYRDVLVISITTAGMDALKPQIIEALQTVFHPAGIYERSDASIRKLEGLEPVTGIIAGKVSPQPIWVRFAGVSLPADVRKGQKTGLYLDQRLNIESLAGITKESRVLDAFSYVGVWGIKAAKSGAREVTFLDSSAPALDAAMMAARRARVVDQCHSLKGDAFQVFKDLIADHHLYDVIFLDPPSFIRSKSRFREGYRGYFDLNRKAVALLASGGILVTSSCSHHMSLESFLEMLGAVLRSAEREGKFLYIGRQALDHPVLPAMPETDYLKCIAVQVL